MRRCVLLTALFFPFWAVPAAFGAYGAYLYLDGIPGESHAEGREGWIDLAAVSHGLTREAGGRAGSSRADFSGVTLVKRLDAATPLLMEACASGRHFAEAVIDLVREEAGAVRFYRIRLKDVLISGVELEGDRGADRLVEPVGLDFRSIEWAYTEFDAAGAEVAEHRAWWDLAEQTGGTETVVADNGPAPTPEGFTTRVSFTPLGDGGAQGVLTWMSVEGREYGIYFSPELDQPFDTLVLTVPSAGDGFTSATVDLPGKRGFFIIREREP